MNLYLIRHGESTWNNENRIQGHSDPGLSRLGKRQARLLAARFKNMNICKVYSSPLSRALQTSRPIARALGLKIIKKENLKEVRLGEWEGKTPGEIDKIYGNRYQKWLKVGPTKVRIPGAEGISCFRERVKKELYGIADENPDRDVIVVTHGGVIASFLAHMLKADFNRLILSLHLPNTCVTTLSFYKGNNCLIHIADTIHLTDKIKGLWPGQK